MSAVGGYDPDEHEECFNEEFTDETPVSRPSRPRIPLQLRRGDVRTANLRLPLKREETTNPYEGPEDVEVADDVPTHLPPTMFENASKPAGREDRTVIVPRSEAAKKLTRADLEEVCEAEAQKALPAPSFAEQMRAALPDHAHIENGSFLKGWSAAWSTTKGVWSLGHSAPIIGVSETKVTGPDFLMNMWKADATSVIAILRLVGALQ